MPKEVFGRGYQFLPRDLLLTFEEIARLAKIFTAHGVEKIRITGGEPLLSKETFKIIDWMTEHRNQDLEFHINSLSLIHI